MRRSLGFHGCFHRLRFPYSLTAFFEQKLFPFSIGKLAIRYHKHGYEICIIHSEEPTIPTKQVQAMLATEGETKGYVQTDRDMASLN